MSISRRLFLKGLLHENNTFRYFNQVSGAPSGRSRGIASRGIHVLNKRQRLFAVLGGTEPFRCTASRPLSSIYPANLVFAPYNSYAAHFWPLEAYS